MRIDNIGYCRLVILIGDKAFKIAKIKPVWFAARIVLFPFAWFLYKGTWKEAFFYAFLLNMNCNREEYRYYNETEDPYVVPTTRCYVFGLIAIQERGESVSADEIAREGLDGSIKVDKPHQYVRLKDGSIRLADYGSHNETIRHLHETLPRRLSSID